jgi:hypothetical protein
MNRHEGATEEGSGIVLQSEGDVRNRGQSGTTGACSEEPLLTRFGHPVLGWPRLSPRQVMLSKSRPKAALNSILIGARGHHGRAFSV